MRSLKIIFWIVDFDIDIFSCLPWVHIKYYKSHQHYNNNNYEVVSYEQGKKSDIYGISRDADQRAVSEKEKFDLFSEVIDKIRCKILINESF